MKQPIPISYSFIEENGFSFHMRKHVKKISMNRMARLWWIARNSPYLAFKEKRNFFADEIAIIKKANGLSISDSTLKKDVELLRSTGVLITVITNDDLLLRTKYKKRNKDIIDQLIACQQQKTRHI